MVYWSELQRKQVQRAHTDLQKFNHKPDGRFRQSVLPYFKEYCENSSIHCVHYLTDDKIQSFEKLIWLLILLATTFGATYVYFELAELYVTQRIQTTIANSVHPIFYVPFPSIGICMSNGVDWPKLLTAHTRFLPANATQHKIEVFRSVFMNLENMQFEKLEDLAPIFENKSLADNLHLIDEVNILEVMTYLTLNCSDIFEWCKWRKNFVNCCEIFSLERTEIGYCQVFNSVISKEQQDRAKRNDYYPYHNSKSGETSGLEVMVKLDGTRRRPNVNGRGGIYVMIKQPEQWYDTPRFISSNTYTKVSIAPQQTDTDARARSVTPDERQCIFEDETHHPLYKKIPGLLYWRGNCRTRCHQEYLMKYCKCTVSLLFPKRTSDNITECKPTDLKCIYEHEEFFSSEHHEAESNYIDDIGNDGMVCNCLNSCNQLLYLPYFTSAPLENTNASDTLKRVHLDMYYQSNYMLKYSTHMRFTFVELLANFGGIIGLFLGASLLSAVELAYYLTFGLYAHLRKQYPTGCCHSNAGHKVKVRAVHRMKWDGRKIKTDKYGMHKY